MKIFILAILLLQVLSIKVDPNNTLFVDQYNRYTVYHGVNAIQKAFPFYPQMDYFDSNSSLNDEDLFNLYGWGFNVVRLHVAWEGVQPERGVYNFTYIQKLREVIRKANKYNISIILDAHQDLFNRQFCGQGFPDWTVKRQSFPSPLKINFTYDEKGYPNLEDCHQVEFALFYTTRDLMKFQEDFFTNERGLLDHYSNMWEQVAAYVNREPNLLGYQILNEPIGANFYRNPANTLLPGVSNNKYLLPAYKKIFKGIRKHDKVNLVFYEPSVIDVFGGGFYETLGTQEEKQNQVFSYHVYCPYVTKTGEPVSKKFCSVFDQLQVQSKEINVRKMKIGGFMTEFGALSDTEKSAEELRILTDLMTDNFRSWSYWQFKYYDDITTAARPGTTQSFYDEQGFLQQTKVKALSRPYAYAICGDPLKEEFKDGVYRLKWVTSRDCYNKNTQIFLSDSFHFVQGFKVKFSKNCGECELRVLNREAKGYYQVLVNKKRRNERVQITISPVI